MLDNRIYTFIKLCDTMNYRKTAELLNMTQPAVTQHVKFLEREYNCKLFNYNYRKLSKTNEAIELENYARVMMKNEVDFRDQINKKTAEHINIGATKTIGDYVILNYVKKYLEIESNGLTLLIDNTSNLLRMLNNNEIDFAIIEGNFDKSYYEYSLFRRERFVGICNKSHKFANKKVSMEQIFNENVIVRELGSGTRNIIEQELLKSSYSLCNFNKQICISSFKIIKELVKSGYGISFVYESIANSDDEIARFELKENEIFREFNIVKLNNLYEDKTNRFLWKNNL